MRGSPPARRRLHPGLRMPITTPPEFWPLFVSGVLLLAASALRLRRPQKPLPPA